MSVSSNATTVSKETAATWQAAGGGGVRAAAITALVGDGRAEVREASPDGHTRAATARFARIAGYSPSVGDRVLVAGEGAELYVIALLHVAQPLGLALDDGCVAALRDGALEVRDPEGRLRLRYAGGAVEVEAAGDLTLAAPAGRVVVRAGADVAIEAARDLTQRAGRRLDLAAGSPEAAPQLQLSPEAIEARAPRVEVDADTARLAIKRAALAAEAIAVKASEIVHAADRYEVSATRLVERARDAFREVTELAQTRAGRIRTIVQDAYALHARRASITSREDTRIDGSRVLLG